jgi:hypothetical protein
LDHGSPKGLPETLRRLSSGGMDPTAFEAYLDDDSRAGKPVPGAARGSAGRAACGDRI